MSDRTFSAALAPFVAAVSLLVLASAAGAQGKPAAPENPVRHVDLELGAGVHFGTAKNTPINDDFYANVGLAVPFTTKLDGEFQIGYWTGTDSNDQEHPKPRSGGPNGAYLSLALRYNLIGAPNDATRFFFSTGPSMIANYRHGDDVTPSWTVGPGFRIMIGRHSGFVARVPVAIMLDGEPQPLLLPTVNYLYQF
jgi:hypothetical protein